MSEFSRVLQIDKEAFVLIFERLPKTSLHFILYRANLLFLKFKYLLFYSLTDGEDTVCGLS